MRKAETVPLPTLAESPLPAARPAYPSDPVNLSRFASPPQRLSKRSRAASTAIPRDSPQAQHRSEYRFFAVTRNAHTACGFARTVHESILEPPDEHFDTPDRTSRQSREAASAATGAP